MLVILLWLVLNSVTFAAPRLAVPPEGVAIGEVAVGSNVVGRVEIRNVGSTTVSVSRVKACCGAKAELSAMKIHIGNNGNIPAVANTTHPCEIPICRKICYNTGVGFQQKE